MKLNRWKSFIASKGLNPKKNRRTFASFLFGLTILVFLIFFMRFIYIVLVGKVGHESLDDKTQQLYRGSSVVKAKRGTIYDRNGEPIAEDATSYSLYAVLDETYLGMSPDGKQDREKLYVQSKDKEEIAKVLADNTNLEADFVMEQLSRNQKQVEFGSGGKNLTYEQKTKIEEALEKKEIKGIYFEKHQARMYPNGVFASHFIGYAQLADADDESKGLVGRMGIEEAQNDILSGEDGEIYFQKDSMQRPIPGTTSVLKEAKDGQDIYTTFDSRLQLYLEELLDETMKKYGPENITATLVEAKSGDIIAAGQRPSFNPETKEGLEDTEERPAMWRNLLVEEPIEPGSTMKVFTMSSALDLQVVNPDEYFQTGHIEVDDARINDWNPQGVGTVTFRQGFAWSSNVGMVLLQQRMGDEWQRYVKRFGFTKPTNINLPGENKGSIQKGTTVDRAMTAFGQAIYVTPMQMVQAYTAIANDGKMMKLNYIDKIVKQDGEEVYAEPEMLAKPIKPQSAHQTLQMMQGVVDDKQYGTGNNFAIEGYPIAAKTGTAQFFADGSYSTSEFLYSVVEIAPTDNPEYILYVTIKRPKEGTGTAGGVMVSEISNPLLKLALDLNIKNSEE